MTILNLAAFVLALATPAQELEAAGAVVRIAIQGGGHGTGFVVDEAGYILTNVHVGGTPLPLQVEVELAGSGDRRPTLSFKKTLIAGVHQSRDLALLKIDPAEHGVRLKKIKVRATPPRVDEAVTAVGYPGDRGEGRTLVTTRGKIVYLNQMVYRQAHLETDVSVWFGNSGGPLLDEKGEAVGVVSRKVSPKDTALAVPIGEFKPQFFVPIRQRVPDRNSAQDLINTAEKAFRRYRETGDFRYLSIGVDCYHEAAVIDVGNETPLVKLGIWYTLNGSPSLTCPYLVRALQINPWPKEGAAVYLALGMSLHSDRQTDLALVVTQEGIRKYPQESGLLWSTVMRMHQDRNDRFSAAAAAEMALSRGAKDREVQAAAPKRGTREWLDDELDRVKAHARPMEELMAEALRAAPAAQQARTPALDPKFAAFLRNYAGVQQEGGAAGLDLKRGTTTAGEADKYTNDEVTTLFIQSQLKVAKEHHRRQRDAVAVSMLKELVRKYPNHPDVVEAEVLLELIEKK